MMRGAALCLVLLLAVGMAAGQGATSSPSPAPEEACTVKEADLAMVNWAPVKRACAVPATTRATVAATNYTTYCNTCICSMSSAIQTGLAAKSIVLTAAQRDSLLTACTTEFLPVLMDDTKANLTAELGEVAGNCGDYAAIVKSCPAVNTTSTNTTTTTVPSPSPSTGGGAPVAPAPGATPVPPPKNSALPLAMSILALAAAVVLQVLLA